MAHIYTHYAFACFYVGNSDLSETLKDREARLLPIYRLKRHMVISKWPKMSEKPPDIQNSSVTFNTKQVNHALFCSLNILS